MNTKKMTRVNRASGAHWVGDGFPVNSLLSYHQQGAEISPFLLLDYAAPTEFAPSDRPRGVGEHPHRGFETVTLVYQGELAHRDNAGHSGTIGPGDVQWMTAARGVIHEEMHSREFTQNGGTLEMVQLWVNLPAAAKMTAPGYQEIRKEIIPQIALPEGAGTLRLVAGSFGDAKGAAKTFTPVNVWDMRVHAGHRIALAIPEGHNTAVLVLSGDVLINDQEEVNAGELAQFTPEGDGISLNVLTDSKLLVLSGEPIHEPILGYGPFVMNTHAEINTALADYAAGRF